MKKITQAALRKKSNTLVEMTDARMYEVLEDFANAHTLAEDIKVSLNSCHRGYTAKDYPTGAKYEDCIRLANIVDGAFDFLMWARRQGTVRVGRAPKKMRTGLK